MKQKYKDYEFCKDVACEFFSEKSGLKTCGK